MDGASKIGHGPGFFLLQAAIGLGDDSSRDTSGVDVPVAEVESTKGKLAFWEDLIEDCEREEESRECIDTAPVESASVKDGDSERDTTTSPAVEALVALVRREVRAAVDLELASLMRGQLFRRQDHSTSARQNDHVGGNSGSEKAAASTAASSCAGVPAPGASSCMTATDVSYQDLGGLSACAGAGLPLVEEHRRAIISLHEDLAWHVDNWDRVWKGEAELRAEGDQEVERRMCRSLESNIQTISSEVQQVNASVVSLARLQAELSNETRSRQEADVKLQAFLREFRDQIIGEIEEMRTRHCQLSNIVEGVRGMVSQTLNSGKLAAADPPALPRARPLSTGAMTVKVPGASAVTGAAANQRQSPHEACVAPGIVQTCGGGVNGNALVGNGPVNLGSAIRGLGQ
eukprot:TRINITY_DN63568_c0_g1_i1.p1 TRINITY_DN63568_c0_g1~~TRINITY_DN63568_c0_g1_i1.p1  ORF type:complete len:403 (+),score=76.20 TRINITY_DN63568_c0_g1_i1:80-1288(+)